MFETTPELMFELYVIAVEYFVYANRDIAPVLVVSVIVGLLSLCFGIANAYVGEDKLVTRLLVVSYLMPCVIARFSMHVALLVELGGGAGRLFACFLLIRVGTTSWRYWPYCREKLGMAILGYLECSIGTVEFIMTVGMVDSLLTYFYPLGTNMDGKRLAHSREKVVLAIAGPLENATVADKVASRPAVMAAVWMFF